MKKVGRPLGSVKKGAFASKSAEAKSSKMQPESEETEIKLDSRSVENKNSKQEISKEVENPVEKHVDHVLVEPVQVTKEVQQMSKELIEKELPPRVIEKEVAESERKDEAESARKDGAESAESKEAEEQDENEESDLKFSLEYDDSTVKARDEKSSEEESLSKENQDSQVRIELETSSQEKKEKISNVTDSQNDSESSSLYTPESLRKDLSVVAESISQTDTRNEKEKDEESTNDKDQPCVSYDPAIMLKDVQIKLNDCMKESSESSRKVFEASSTGPDCGRERESEPDRESDQEMPSRPYQDLSFGKTLRSISGRRSLNRMRHVTIREHRYSPNNSMFVNMSSTSLMPDDNEDLKILRYSSGLPDTVSTSNGSPTEKKRKLETSEDWSSVTKKQKTNESDNSLLNSSLGLLKGFRRPIQVSTPVSELKFQTNKLDPSDEEANKQANDRAAKKWCAIM